MEDHVFRYANNASAANSSAPAGHVPPADTVLWWTVSRKSCIAVYVSLNVVVLAVISVRCLMFVSFFTRTSMSLHNAMFRAMTRATMVFFNSNSSGNAIPPLDLSGLGKVVALKRVHFFFFFHSALITRSETTKNNTDFLVKTVTFYRNTHQNHKTR